MDSLIKVSFSFNDVKHTEEEITGMNFILLCGKAINKLMDRKNNNTKKTNKSLYIWLPGMILPGTLDSGIIGPAIKILQIILPNFDCNSDFLYVDWQNITTEKEIKKEKVTKESVEKMNLPTPDFTLFSETLNAFQVANAIFNSKENVFAYRFELAMKNFIKSNSTLWNQYKTHKLIAMSAGGKIFQELAMNQSFENIGIKKFEKACFLSPAWICVDVNYTILKNTIVTMVCSQHDICLERIALLGIFGDHNFNAMKTIKEMEKQTSEIQYFLLNIDSHLDQNWVNEVNRRQLFIRIDI